VHFFQVLKQGLRNGVNELRARRERARHYGESADEEEFSYITDIYIVFYIYKSQFENTARMLACPPKITKKVKNDLKKSNTNEMVGLLLNRVLAVRVYQTRHLSYFIYLSIRNTFLCPLRV